MQTRSLIVSNQLSALDDIESTLEELSASWNLTRKFELELNLVLEELITNIINYGYPDNLVHEIEIIFSCNTEILKISITDNGNPFDPKEYNPHYDLKKPLKDRAIGGVGLHLVKTLMDTISYQRAGDKNILVISRKR